MRAIQCSGSTRASRVAERAPRSAPARATARVGNWRDGARRAVDEGVNRHTRGACAPRYANNLLKRNHSPSVERK